MDPVLIFLITSWPLLSGTIIYFYLKDKRTSALLREEYLIKWHLHGFAKACLTEIDLQTIREELTENLLRLIRPTLIILYELDAETNCLRFTHQAGIKNIPDQAIRGYTLSAGIPGWVMQNQTPAIINDVSQDMFELVDPWIKGSSLKSFAIIPFIVRGNPTGIIAMYSVEARFFNDSRVLIAQIVAQLYGLALDRLIGK